MIKLPNVQRHSVDGYGRQDICYNDPEGEFVYYEDYCALRQELDSLRAEVQRLNATAQPVSDGWVNYKEIKPEVGQEVILFADGYVEGGYRYIEAGYFIDTMGGSYAAIEYATHWMPLPAAPGGQS